MIRNRTAQLVFQSCFCALGMMGVVASMGLFKMTFYWDFYVYFTNLSNYLCIGVMLAELIQTIRKRDDSFVSAAPKMKFIGMMSIVLTFLVFNLLLAGSPDRNPEDNFTVNSILFHGVLPVAYVADWVLFYERKKTRWTDALLCAAFPLCYLGFLAVQALVLGFNTSILNSSGARPLIYPYFFVDVDQLGWGGVGTWVLILSACFIVTGFLFFGLDHLSIRKKKMSV